MPRGYAWVMTAATVPAITLLLFLIGLGSRLFVHVGPRFFGRAPAERTDRAHTDLLWAICLVVPYAPWFSTNTPIFGGTKHWMTAYPFLCLFAAMGFELVAAAVRRYFNEQAPRFARWGEAARKAASAATGPACNVALGAMVSPRRSWKRRTHTRGACPITRRSWGAPGAASLGLNRQFWGFTTGAVTDFLNSHVPPGGTVYMHDTAGDSWDLLQRDGRLDRRIQGAWHPHAGTSASITTKITWRRRVSALGNVQDGHARRHRRVRRRAHHLRVRRSLRSIGLRTTAVVLASADHDQLMWRRPNANYGEAVGIDTGGRNQPRRLATEPRRARRRTLRWRRLSSTRKLRP